MKKSVTKILVVVMAVSCITCFAGVVKETRDIGSFNQINLSGAETVYLTQGANDSVAVETDKNNLSNVETNVTDNTLIVKTDCNRSWWNRIFSSSKEVKIYITAKNIDSITSSGAAKINIDNINNQKFSMTLSGADHVDISGKTDDFTVQSSGAIHLEAKEFKAHNIDIKMSGAAHAEIFATGTINAKISGVGNIEYYGNPKIVKPEISGLGKISDGEK